MVSKAVVLDEASNKRSDEDENGNGQASVNENGAVDPSHNDDLIDLEDPPVRESNDENDVPPTNGNDEDSSHSLEELRARAACYEEMPSSDESVTKLMSTNLSLPDAERINQQLSFPELLEFHQNQASENLFSGFEFGEATKRRVEQNKKASNKPEGDKIYDNPPGSVDNEKPGCSSEKDHKTPHSHKRQRLGESKEDLAASDADLVVNVCRQVPKSIEDQAECVQVWNFMVNKEDAMLKFRNPRLFYDFKMVTPRMRAILLDWLMEVSEVYHLRRVTYYLSVDYFDRFISIRTDIPKSLLQLVGITCLYIAAKVEEIYPPNLKELAYVCDGACKEKDMVACEILILNSLGWEVVLTTPSDWLNLYMQLHHKTNDLVRCRLSADFNNDFVYPQYSAYHFTRASQLMDLLSLDPGFLKFGYSLIAAAAMYFMYGTETALEVSGFTWEQLEPCVSYMTVFYKIVKAPPDPRLQSCLSETQPEDAHKSLVNLPGGSKGAPRNESYSLQTHVASMEYFEQAAVYRLSQITGRIPRDDASSLTPLEDAVLHTDDDVEADIDSLINDIKSLDKESIVDSGKTSSQSLDEIFEMIFSHEDLPSPSTNDS